MTNAITDFNQYTALRVGADRNDPEVLREVAGQFEALFVQTMLKNMREASLGDPLMGDSNQYEMYQGMLDQQLALEMSSGHGIGLADMLVRQLGGDVEIVPAPRANAPPVASQGAVWKDAESFTRDVWPHAERVANRLNVPTEAIVAQAALETGWGAHVPQRGDGSSSFNLFGIKAGQNWSGSRVTKTTLEFADGLPKPEVASFRAYDDVAATFDDYSELLLSNPRYATVRGHDGDVAAFAAALQASGYATDPAYAYKIQNIADSEIMQRALHSLKSGASAPITERRTTDAI
jgi:flagellar protein FlgJ